MISMTEKGSIPAFAALSTNVRSYLHELRINVTLCLARPLYLYVILYI